MKSSNNLILSIVFLTVLLFINEIGSANSLEENEEKFKMPIMQSRTYRGICEDNRCSSACVAERFQHGFCYRKGRKPVCMCSNFNSK
ncbi:hypothetical protein ABFS82_11G099100 [Erythranthe guttata]